MNSDALTYADVIGGPFGGQRWSRLKNQRFTIKALVRAEVYAVYAWHDGAWVHVHEMSYREFIHYQARAAMTPDCGGK